MDESNGSKPVDQIFICYLEATQLIPLAQKAYAIVLNGRPAKGFKNLCNALYRVQKSLSLVRSDIVYSTAGKQIIGHSLDIAVLHCLRTDPEKLIKELRDAVTQRMVDKQYLQQEQASEQL